MAMKDEIENVCYWIESQLECELHMLAVPINLLCEIGQNDVKSKKIDVDAFERAVVRTIKEKDIVCPLGRYMCKKKKYHFTSIHELVLDATKNRSSWESFIKKATEALTTERCKEIQENTKYRYNDPSMYLEMRYGRISSSKVYECMSKNIPFDKLYHTIMGFHKHADTTEINRKRHIELNVRQQLEFFAKCKYENAGLFISSEFPLIIAIPDGICDTHIVEIKCPTTAQDMARYMSDGEQLSPKYYTEMQVQMYVSGKAAGVVCVADPDFEKNKNIYIQTVALDRNYAKDVMTKAQEYWRNFIFPYELTKWCVEREDAKTGALPSLDGLKELDPKREKDEIEIGEKTIITQNGHNGTTNGTTNGTSAMNDEKE